jgi:hypothetical protein
VLVLVVPFGAGGSSASTLAGAPATRAQAVTNDNNTEHERRTELEDTMKQL